MENYDPEQEYLLREKKYKEQFEKDKQQFNALSNLRLVAFLGIITGAVFLYLSYYILGSVLFVISLVSFIILIVMHEKVKVSKEKALSLVEINQKALGRIKGEWVEFEDKGEEFIDQKHPYSIDLDIFGQASVFQWINTTVTPMGRKLLKGILTNPLKDRVKIKERQDAITELSDKLDLRQQFLSEGSFDVKEMKDPDDLLEWANNKNPMFRYAWVGWGVKILTALTVVSIFLPFLSFGFFLYMTIPLLLIQAILFIVKLKYYFNVFEVAGRYKDQISVLQKLLTVIENESFESRHLKGIKEGLTHKKGSTTSGEIRELSVIVDMMSFKYSPAFYLLLNLIFLWDYHCMVLLERWKEQSGHNIGKWLDAVGRFDELISLANVRYDNPEWCIPQITNKKHFFSAKGMGHPLLPKGSRICNDLDINGFGNVLLITGSNMSGKSTLLRTVGLNLILACTGVPVCAIDFKCSVMDVYTSMRVNDNLEKKISSFYAELLRIKTIIEAASTDNSLLFLLDEVFRGTNTRDRHAGASAVLRKLSKMGAVGLVSTHDLELGELENDKDMYLRNYHFVESYDNNRIVFDYKLYPGVSKTTNAIYLMKMVGINEF